MPAEVFFIVGKHKYIMTIFVLSRDASSLAATLLPQVKAHCAIDQSNDDQRITNYIKSAIATLERETHRCFVTTQMKDVRPHFFTDHNKDGGFYPYNGFAAFPYFTSANYGGYAWPVRYEITLVKSPVKTIDSITYYDQQNNLQTLDPLTYTVMNGTNAPCKLYPTNPPMVWPYPYFRIDAVTITYTCGYDSVPGGLPDDFYHCVNLLVGEMNEIREGKQERQVYSGGRLEDLIDNLRFPTYY